MRNESLPACEILRFQHEYRAIVEGCKLPRVLLKEFENFLPLLVQKLNPLQITVKSPVEDRREKGVELGSGLGLNGR